MDRRGTERVPLQRLRHGDHFSIRPARVQTSRGRCHGPRVGGPLVPIGYRVAKQYSNPAPPVLFRPSSLHPFEACDEFHDLAVSSGAVPLRS
jgi:hypothetical protein